MSRNTFTALEDWERLAMQPGWFMSYRAVTCPRCGTPRLVPATFCGTSATDTWQAGYVCECGWWVQP